MKKKILFVAQYTSIPGENDNNRFTYLINKLKENNDIELITTNFSHSNKQHRDSNKVIPDEGYKVTLIDEPGYKKNVSLRRFYSHHVLAKNLEKYLEKIDKPDVIYCAIPSLDVAFVTSKYAKKNNIRFIIDIQDLWPEAFKMVFNIPIISSIIFFPMERKANEIYKSADDIVAVSNTYADRAGTVNKKYKNKISVFLGTDLDYFDECKEENKIDKFDDVIRVAYIGTLGHSYDLKCVIDSIKILQQKNIKNILFVVMGKGPLRAEFEEYAKEKGINAEFVGYLNYEEMVGKLCSCDIAVNPITKGAAQSIINKVGDYAAAGLPVVSTQESVEYRKLVEDYQIGFNVECGNSEELANKIEELCKDKDLRERLGKNNRKLAEEKFNRKETYLEIEKLIEG